MVGKDSHVNLWIGKGRKSAVVIGTETDGVALVELTRDSTRVNVPNFAGEGLPNVAKPVLKYDDSFRINVPYVWCTQGGSEYSWLAVKQLSTQDILQHGYVSPNTCGKAMNAAKAGQILLFVRPLTFWEEFKE